MTIKTLRCFLGDACYRQMEYCFNADFSAVHIIISDHPKQYRARAFTDGNDIYILPQYAHTLTVNNLWLIAHELAHIVQRRQKRVPLNHTAYKRAKTNLENEAVVWGVWAVLGYQVNDKPVLTSASDEIKLIQCSQEQEEDEGYRSDEDDEKPISREHFNDMVSLIRAIYNKLRDFTKDPRMIGKVAEIKKQIEDASKTLKEQGHAPIPVFEMNGPSDWFAFAYAMRRFLNENYPKENKYPVKTKNVDMEDEEDSEQDEAVEVEEDEEIDEESIAIVAKKEKDLMPYLPAYDFKLALWKGASQDSIQVRRVEVGKHKTKLLVLHPGTNKGRGYREIAYDLYRMSQLIGSRVLGIEPKTSAELWQCGELGERILANAIMYTYSGRGNEVGSWLTKLLLPSDMKQLEHLTLEYIALNFGFEGGRLPYTQFDNLIHLANIASGATFGFDQREQRFSFLNVLSWVREIDGQYKHIYALDEGMNTKYRGFLVTDLEQSLSKYDDKQQRKVPALGKQASTSSGAFYWLRLFLQSMGLSIKATDELFKQLKKTLSDKSSFHQRRFQFIGPIRVYNTIANLLRNSGINSEEHIGSLYEYAYDLIDNTYAHYLVGEPTESPTFSRLFPDPDVPFADKANEIVRDTKQQQERLITIGNVLSAILGDPQIDQLYANIASASNREAALKEFRSYVAKHHNLISKLFQSYPSLMTAFIRAHANDCFTDDYSFLQKALMIGHIGLVESLLEHGANWNYANKVATVDDLVTLHDPIENLYQEGSLLQIATTTSVATQYARDWLLSDHIEGILEDYRSQREKDGSPGNLMIMPAENNCNRLSGRNQAISYLQQGFDKLKDAEGVILVPIHWSNHWCSLVIHKTKDSVSAYYFDSSGKNLAREGIVKSILDDCKVANLSAKCLQDLSLDIQQDGYTCGTWATEAGKIIAEQCLSGKQVAEIKETLAKDLNKLQPTVKQLHDHNWSTHSTGLAHLAIETSEASHPLYKINLKENAVALGLFDLIKTQLTSDILDLSVIREALAQEDIPYAQLKLAMQSLMQEFNTEELFKFAIDNKVWELVHNLLPVIEITPKISEMIEQFLEQPQSGEDDQQIEIMVKLAFDGYLGAPTPDSRYWIDSATIQEAIDKLETDKVLFLAPYDAHDITPGRVIDMISQPSDVPIVCPINLGQGNWVLLIIENGDKLANITLYCPKDDQLDKKATAFGHLVYNYLQAIGIVNGISFERYNCKGNDDKGGYVLAAIDVIYNQVALGAENEIKPYQLLTALDDEDETIKKQAQVFLDSHRKEVTNYDKTTSSLGKSYYDKWLDSSQINLILHEFKSSQKGIHILSAGSFGEKSKVSLQQNLLDVFNNKEVNAIIVPVNCRNRHWCNLLICKDHEGNPVVFFFDSKGLVPENKALALEAIESLQGEYPKLQFMDLSQCVQSNGYACGTWMTSSAMWLVQAYQAYQETIKLPVPGNMLLGDFLKQEFEQQFLKKTTETKLNEDHELNLATYPRVDDGFTGVEVEKAAEFPDARLTELSSKENIVLLEIAKELYQALQIEGTKEIQAAYNKMNKLTAREKGLILYYCHYHLLITDNKHPLDIALRLENPILFRDFFNRVDCNIAEPVRGKTILKLVLEKTRGRGLAKELTNIAQQVLHGVSTQSKFVTDDLYSVLVSEIKDKNTTLLETYDVNSSPDTLFTMMTEYKQDGTVVCPIVLKNDTWALLIKHKEGADVTYSLMIQGKAYTSTQQKELTTLFSRLLGGAEVSRSVIDDSPMALVAELENRLKEINNETLLSEEELAERTEALISKYYPDEPPAIQTLLEDSARDPELSVTDASESIRQLNDLNWQPKSIWQGKQKFTTMERKQFNETGLLVGCKDLVRRIDGQEQVQSFSTAVARLPPGKKRKTMNRFEDQGEVELIDFSHALDNDLPKQIAEKIKSSDSKLIMWMVKVDAGYYFPLLYNRDKNEVLFWDMIESTSNDGRKSNLMKWLFSNVSPNPTIHDNTTEAIAMSQGKKKDKESDTEERDDEDKKQRKYKPKLKFESMFNATMTCLVNYIDRGEKKQGTTKPTQYYSKFISHFSSVSTLSFFLKQKITFEFNIKESEEEIYDQRLNEILDSSDIKGELAKLLREITSPPSLNVPLPGSLSTHALLTQQLNHQLKNPKDLILLIMSVVKLLNTNRKNVHLKDIKLVGNIFLQFLGKLLDIAYEKDLLKSIGLPKEDLLALVASDYAAAESASLEVNDYLKLLYGVMPVSEYHVFSGTKDDINATSHNAFTDLHKILDPFVSYLQGGDKKPTVEAEVIAQQIKEFYTTYGRVAWQVLKSLAQQPNSDMVYVKAAVLLGNDRLLKDMLSTLSKEQYVGLLNTTGNELLSKAIMQVARSSAEKVDNHGRLPMKTDKSTHIDLFAPDVVHQIRELYQSSNSESQQFLFKIDEKTECFCQLQGNELSITLLHDEDNYVSLPLEHYITALFCQATGNKEIDIANQTTDEVAPSMTMQY